MATATTTTTTTKTKYKMGQPSNAFTFTPRPCFHFHYLPQIATNTSTGASFLFPCLNLIWVSSLGVRFEVAGKITPCLKLVKIMLET